MTPSKSKSANGKKLKETVNALVRSHFEIQPDLQRIIWFPDEASREIRLLEVNPNTFESETVKAYLMLPAGDIAFPVRLADVTPHEWDQIREGKKKLPSEWNLKKSEEFKPPLNPKKVKRIGGR